MSGTAGSREMLLSVVADIEACRTEPAAEAGQRFAAATRRVIRYRNGRLRQAPGQGAGECELARINGLLSLMASVEFPLGGFHRERLDDIAAALMRDLQ